MEQKSSSEINPISSSIKKHLPPVKDLIVQSWELLTKKALKLLFFGLFSLAIYFVMVLLVTITIFGTSVWKASALTNPNALFESILTPEVIGTAIISAILFVIGMIFVATAFQAAVILLLRDKEEETSVVTYFKQGFAFVKTLLFVGSITFIIVFGSFFVFVIPALVIGIFFMFTLFTVVLDNKKGMGAIKMSIGMISQNFGGVVGRIILLYLLSFAVQMLIGMLPHDEPSAALLYMLLSVVSSFVIGWFSLTYLFKLYEHARAIYDEKKSVSLTWMWVVSILGWIIASLFLTGIFSAIRNKDLQRSVQKVVEKEMSSQFKTEESMDFGSEFEETTRLDQQILVQLNIARAMKELAPLQEDQKLCGYAARRLKQLKDFGGFDDYAGFYEDTGNKSMWNTFFQGYENVTNIVRERLKNTENESAEMATSIIEKNGESAVLSGKYTNICIRFNDDFASLVLGENKGTQSL